MAKNICDDEDGNDNADAGADGVGRDAVVAMMTIAEILKQLMLQMMTGTSNRRILVVKRPSRHTHDFRGIFRTQ